MKFIAFGGGSVLTCWEHICGTSRQFQGHQVIYVNRNPKDVIVSYYNHRRRYTEKDLGKSAPHSPLLFDDFFQAMTTTYNVYGGWFNHVSEYYRHKGEENIFVVSYEEIKEDLLKVIKQLSKFLGKHIDDDSVLRVLEASSLSAMKTVYKREQEENMKQGKEEIDVTLVFNEGWITMLCSTCFVNLIYS